MGSRILIVEDEAKLREVLCDYFSSKGDLPVAASNGVEALERMGEESIDAVLLDMMMPELDGLSVCRALRRTSDVPILFLTALSDEEDKLMGYALGADDYITKPFVPMEVLARVRSQLRRYTRLGGQAPEKPSILTIGGICLDDEAKSVTVDGEPANLTPMEFAILRLLMSNPGKVYSSRSLYEAVWNEAPLGSEGAVAVHIRHLREKIEINPSDPRYLKVVWGQGYKMEGGKP